MLHGGMYYDFCSHLYSASLRYFCCRTALTVWLVISLDFLDYCEISDHTFLMNCWRVFLTYCWWVKTFFRRLDMAFICIFSYWSVTAYLLNIQIRLRLSCSKPSVSGQVLHIKRWRPGFDKLWEEKLTCFWLVATYGRLETPSIGELVLITIWAR